MRNAKHFRSILRELFGCYIKMVYLTRNKNVRLFEKKGFINLQFNLFAQRFFVTKVIFLNLF